MIFLTSSGNDVADALKNILPSGSPSTASGFWDIFKSWGSLSEFYKQNQVLLVLGVCLLALVWSIVMWIRRKQAKKNPDPMKALGADAFFKFAAGLLIILLMASDLFAMYNMFSSFRLRPEESVIFSFTFALFLEGFPFALGFIDPLKKDPAQFIMARKTRYKIMSRICWVFLSISWGLAILIRYMYTQQPIMGGFEAFWNGQYNSSRNQYANNAYLAQVFLFVSPILTSILAYVLSCLAFGSSCLEEAAKIRRAAHARFTAAQKAYSDINHKRLDAANVLWASLTEDPTSVPPSDFDDFRNQSIVYIHEMLISGCLDAYPALLKRYNYEVETALAHYIVELSKLSSTPHLISQISVQQITDNYDARMTKDIDKWEYELCEPAMCGDLEQLLHDAVIGAQFRNIPQK